jgi:hypothetical protein
MSPDAVIVGAALVVVYELASRYIAIPDVDSTVYAPAGETHTSRKAGVGSLLVRFRKVILGELRLDSWRRLFSHHRFHEQVLKVRVPEHQWELWVGSRTCSGLCLTTCSRQARVRTMRNLRHRHHLRSERDS